MIRNGVWKILPQTKLFFVVRMCSVMSDSCDPLDCSPPGSSVHGILQARILEWVAMPSSRGSSQPRDGTATHMDKSRTQMREFHFNTHSRVIVRCFTEGGFLAKVGGK